MRNDGKRNIQICQLLEFKPYGIHKMSKCNEFAKSRFAISRRDGSIEVWKYISDENHWHNELRINGRKDYLIESLLWTQSGHLLSGDSNGEIIEYDMNKYMKLTKTNSHQKSISCMDYCVKNDSLLVGCEEGVVLLYKCSPLTYIKTVLTAESSICSISWHISGEHLLLTTLSSTPLIYSFINSLQISIGTCFKKQILIWACLFLSDWTVVLADSTGSVQFWDGYTAIQSHIFRCHQADVLDICVSNDENMLISCSVDKTLCRFIRDSDRNWAVTKVERAHFNDVTCLGVDNVASILLSAGSDGICNTYSIENFELNLNTTFGIFNQHSKFKVSSDGYRVLQISSRSLTIWQFFINETPPQNMFQIDNETMSNFYTGGISNSGEFISVSSSTSFFIYHIKKSHSGSYTSIQKLSTGSLSCKSYIGCHFSADSSQFAYVTNKLEVFILNITTMSIVFKTCINISTDVKIFGKCDIDFYNDNNIIFIMNSYPTVIISIDVSNQSITDICCLSRVVVAHTLVPHLNQMFVMCKDSYLFSFDISNPGTVIRHKLKLKQNNISHIVIGMFHDHFTDSIIFYSFAQLMKLKLKSLLSSKSKITNNEEAVKKRKRLALTYLCDYQPILCSALFKDGSMLVLQKSMQDIYSSSNQPIHTKKFKQS